MPERDVESLLAANDPLLERLIAAPTEAERHAELEAVLLEHVVPVVRRIVRRHQYSDRLLTTQDAEDIVSAVVVRLVRKLQRVPFERIEAIDRLEDFAAASTFNAIRDFLRVHFPERARLQRRVRYLLASDGRFRTWPAAAGTACGLAEWDETAETCAPAASWTHHDPERMGDAVESLLRLSGGPLLIAAVVRVLAGAWKIADERPTGDEEAVDAGVSQAGALESRERLAALWRETQALPAPQRTALLLHLRDVDGGSAIALFPLLGVASLDDVAAAIDVPLQRLAKLWPRLPLDDLAIAAILDVSRQKVINLRLAARQRLARRLKKW